MKRIFFVFLALFPADLFKGLSQANFELAPHMAEHLNAQQVQLLKRQMIEDTLTLLENRNNLIPLDGLDALRIASISVGADEATPFQYMLENYSQVDHFVLPGNFSNIESLKEKLKKYNLVITGIHSPDERKERCCDEASSTRHEASSYADDLTGELEAFLHDLSVEKRTIIVFFSSPYVLSKLKNKVQPDGMIIAYQNDTLCQELSAQLIFGAIKARGKLPAFLTNDYPAGYGLSTGNPIRLKYTIPEEVGISSARLNRRVDSIVHNAIQQRAFPGCNILVAKNGNVIFHKAYGYHTFDDITPTRESDLYDLASVTKISGALPAIMKLNEDGKYLLDEKFSTYWTDWKKGLFHRSNKEDITVRELLAHQAGLIPYIGFWKEALKHNRLSSTWYSLEKYDKYTLTVAPNLYLNRNFKHNIYKSVRLSELKNRGTYVYSDLSFVIVPEIITKLSGMDFVDFLDNNFYRPLGAYTMTYNPLDKFPRDRMAPTENDQIFRKRQIQGTVHDESAAVLGGISGNAGLFASANDLAKLLQMYMQMGTYGGRQYLKASTMKEFIRVQYPQHNNRRALGFDKPLLNNKQLSLADAYPISEVSPESFGHSGFTGIFVWVDPTAGWVYIFMSNRVYPTRENRKIFDLNVRTSILRVFYEEAGRAKLPTGILKNEKIYKSERIM